jgi:cell division protein FtsB
METDIRKLFSDRPQNYNNITSLQYQEFIISDESVNSFLIFKCAKETFNSNIKNNEFLYISITFLVVQIILLGIFAKLKSKYIKMEEKKEEDKTKEKKQKKKNNKKKKRDIKTDKKCIEEDKKESKANPPKVGNFSISDDLEEEGNSVFEKDKNVEKDMQEKDKEKFHNNDSELSDKRRDICNNNIQDKDIDSSVVKDIKSKKPNLDAELIRNQVIIRENEQGDEDEEEEDNEEEGE